MTGRRHHPFLDAPGPLAFAHRGGAAQGVENALSSFATVRSLGYRYVETDVRSTADGVPVVFHDEDVARLTGSVGRIGELTLAAVKALALQEDESIATLEDALCTFPDLRFNIDLKDGTSVRTVPEVLRRTAALDRVCLTSFSQRRVRQAQRLLGPELCTGLGVGGCALLLACGLTRLPWHGAAAVLQVPWYVGGGRTLPERVVELGHRAGLAVHAWTVDDPAAMAAALDLGIDGIMTDEPAVLKDVLVARGLWT